MSLQIRREVGQVFENPWECLLVHSENRVLGRSQVPPYPPDFGAKILC
jgi:hypothetical protein